MNKIHLVEINSTNTYAKENIDKFEDKTVIYTDRQTAGRGRFTRKWFDLGSRNLYMTIVLHPGEKFIETYSNLTQYLALKTCKVLEAYGVNSQIKWPNDNLVNGKKIGGILSETVFKGDKLKGIALGIGVNLNAKLEEVKAIPDRIATALNLEINQPIDRDKFLDVLIESFFEDYEEFLKKGFSSIRDEYLKYSVLIGENITINHLNKQIQGKFKTINSDGTIQIETTSGSINLSIGDIMG